MSDEEILIKYFGGKPQWSGNKLYKIGDLRVEYHNTSLYKVGGAKIEYHNNKLYKINGERVTWNGEKVYKIGDKVGIRVKNANKLLRQIDFEVIKK